MQREAGLDNAWFRVELQIIAWAAGWLETAILDDRGRLRPPMHYE